jgi:hypothetical protein
MLHLRIAAGVASALLVLLPAALTAPLPGGGAGCAKEAVDYESELFFAVLEGLYRDGVTNDVVEGLLVPNDAGGAALFVPGCPICTPAFNAFLVYRTRPAFAGKKIDQDTFGPGLPEGVAAACTGPDMDARFKALNGLIEGWVAQHIKSRRLTADEAAEWRRIMEEWRKKGMGGLQQQQVAGRDFSLKTCAVCDAANGVFGQLR